MLSLTRQLKTNRIIGDHPDRIYCACPALCVSPVATSSSAQSTADARRINSVKSKKRNISPLQQQLVSCVTEGRRVFLACPPPSSAGQYTPLPPPLPPTAGRESTLSGPVVLAPFCSFPSACVCVCVCGARVCASNRSSTDHWHTRTGGTTESRRRRPGVDDHVLPPSRRDFVRVKRALQRPPNEISPSGRGSGGSRLKSPVVRPLTDCRRRVLAASVNVHKMAARRRASI